MAEYYSIVYMYHIFLIQSSVDGHLGCFHVWALKIVLQWTPEYMCFVSHGFLWVDVQEWDCWIKW